MVLYFVLLFPFCGAPSYEQSLAQHRKRALKATQLDRIRIEVQIKNEFLPFRQCYPQCSCSAGRSKIIEADPDVNLRLLKLSGGGKRAGDSLKVIIETQDYGSNEKTHTHTCAHKSHTQSKVLFRTQCLYK